MQNQIATPIKHNLAWSKIKNSASATSSKVAMSKQVIGAPHACKEKMAGGRPKMPAHCVIVDNFSQNIIYDKLYCRENSAVSRVF